MIRQALVVGIAVCLAPSLASAQSPEIAPISEFTVSVQSAAVRKAPRPWQPARRSGAARRRARSHA